MDKNEVGRKILSLADEAKELRPERHDEDSLRLWDILEEISKLSLKLID